MRSFTRDGSPVRVVFGAGSFAAIGDEIATAGLERVLLISTPGRRALADRAATALGRRAAAICDGAVMHVPAASAAAAVALARATGADGCVALGGGSSVGLAKAVALDTGLPILAVPTTFAGSEMTPIYGISAGGEKRVGRDRRVLPRAVIYDPELLAQLPPAVAAASGMNAIAHAVEALYAAAVDPVTALLAEESVRALAESLPRVVARPGDVAALSDALYGSWLAGTCLGAAAMGLHHKLCHVLGGRFGLPHAETHAVVLPHATAYNQLAAPAAMHACGRALGCAAAEVPARLFDLAAGLGAPSSLRALGMPEDGLEQAAALAAQARYPNPRPVERDALVELLRAAFAGGRPA